MHLILIIFFIIILLLFLAHRELKPETDLGRLIITYQNIMLRGPNDSEAIFVLITVTMHKKVINFFIQVHGCQKVCEGIYGMVNSLSPSRFMLRACKWMHSSSPYIRITLTFL